MTSLFEDHLTLDAIVAFADGEMSLTAYQRAAAHLSRCTSCAAEVAEQTAASQYLRQAHIPSMPGSLFDALKSIPVALPQAGPVPGVVVDSSSGRVIGTGDHGSGRGRRFRLGAGALVTGIAMGAVVVAAGGDGQGTNPARPSTSPDRTAFSRPSPSLHSTVVNVVARSTVTSPR